MQVSKLVVATGLVAIGLVSCLPDSQIDAVQFSDGTLKIEHQGNLLVYIDQYSNGARITVSLPDKSEVILSLDQKMTGLEEVVVIKSVGKGSHKSIKSIIIDDEGEVQTQNKTESSQKEYPQS